MAEQQDRFGLGFRPELAGGILSNAAKIDLVEVIADDYFDAPKKKVDALKLLAANIPLTLHGVSLGLASSSAIEQARANRIERLCDRVQPIYWSEHLAFVRAGGVEIGHLAMPPKNEQTIEGAVENYARLRGAKPRLENIATLAEPPGSTMDEASWVSRIADETGAKLLLDLHNLYANALNTGRDPLAVLESYPLDRVRSVHLAGGRYLVKENVRRVLDDHLHDVPDPIFALLEALAARTVVPLDVVIERDGNYPPIGSLLAELDAARAAVARGRASPVAWSKKVVARGARARLAADLETSLARYYGGKSAKHEGADRIGLEMARESYAKKRALGRTH